MIGIIVAAVTFAAMSGLAIHYNINVEQDGFMYAIAGEVPDVLFILKNKENADAFKGKLLDRPEVRKAFGYEPGMNPLFINGTEYTSVVVEDCSLLEGRMLIDGRYPKHNNEIALGTATAKVTGYKTGDTVVVRNGENEKNYLVTGIIQLANNNGFNVMLTGNALMEIQPDYEFVSFNVYLTAGSDGKIFAEETEAIEGDIFESAVAIRDLWDSQMGGMGDAFAAVAVGIIVVTAVVVILVLYMVIKTTILRKKRELGIQKAIGFTTFQLMNQIALNLTPVILSGVIIGALAGYFGFNPIFVLLTSSIGIAKVELPVPLDWTVMVCVALVLLAYGVSMLIAWRIRKISAYSLISEYCRYFSQ
jgi:putative ABC transport system permease protein